MVPEVHLHAHVAAIAFQVDDDPGAELRIYADAPHGLVITHKDRLTKDLLAFIASA